MTTLLKVQIPLPLHGELNVCCPRYGGTKGQTQVEHVAFYSTVSVRNLTNLGMHQTIIFDRVITNNGGAYNPHTGIFIALLNGVYVFNVGAMSSHMKLEYLELVQDDTFIQGVFPDAGTIEAFASDSLAAVLELNKGNEAWERTGGRSGEIHGNSFTFILDGSCT